MTLDERRGRARRSRRSPAELGLEDRRLAEGMLAIVNAKMADAMRTITVKQGIEPRDFALVAFGGAGPMHAVWLAEELEIARGDRPVESRARSPPGACCRRTCATTSCGASTGRSPSSRADDVETCASSLEARGPRGAPRAEGVDARRRGYFARSPTCATSARSTRSTSLDRRATSIGEIDGDVPRRARVRYGHSTPGAPVEFVNLRARGARPHRPRADSPCRPPRERARPGARRRARSSSTASQCDDDRAAARPAAGRRRAPRARWSSRSRARRPSSRPADSDALDALGNS